MDISLATAANSYNVLNDHVLYRELKANWTGPVQRLSPASVQHVIDDR